MKICKHIWHHEFIIQNGTKSHGYSTSWCLKCKKTAFECKEENDKNH